MAAILDFGGHLFFSQTWFLRFYHFYIVIYNHATFYAIHRKFTDYIMYLFNEIRIKMLILVAILNLKSIFSQRWYGSLQCILIKNTLKYKKLLKHSIHASARCRANSSRVIGIHIIFALLWFFTATRYHWLRYC